MALLDAAYRDCRTIRAADATLCYRRQGAGPPLLLVHGVPLSLITWRHVLDELSRSFTVIAPDLKGFGRSEKPRGDYTVEAHARTLLALIEALHLDGVTLVASSYGCAPAIHAAVARPDRVARLVLINSVGAMGNRHRAERLLRIAGVTPIVRAALKRTGLRRRLFTARLRRCYADPAGASDELISAYLDLLRDGDGEASFLATLRSFDERQIAARLRDVRQPTLIVWGSEDRVLPIGAGRRLQSRIRGAQLEVLSGCGHLPHEEAPQRFSRLVAAFSAPAAYQPAR